ncbi:MAG: universal stress protein, partial [Ilumatobacteraceae bacterium]
DRMNPTITFGDDHSVSADLAWLWITCHDWPHWHLDILTAVVPPLGPVAQERAQTHEWTSPHPRRVHTDLGFDDVTHLAIDEDPRLALSRATDLLVIGPRGPGVFKALHLGSTAEWLLSRPPSPMLIPRHGRTTRTALICHDGSAHAEKATATLARLPWVNQLEITVVTVDDGRTDPEAAVASAMQMLTTPMHHLQLTGDPTQELLQHLEQHPVDLVVFGTRGLTGIRRLRVGSTAAVLAHAIDHSILIACDDAVDPDPSL